LAEGVEASEKDKKLIQVLQEDNVTRLEEEHKLREELELTREELLLTQEELKAVEYDAQEVHSNLDDIRAQHRLEVNNLKSLTQGNANAEKVVGQMVAASEETDELKDEITRLNAALKNAKKDRDAIVEELEAVNDRFDEARQEAENRGRDLASSDVRAQVAKEREGEISGLKDQLSLLAKENVALQQKVDDSEMSLAASMDSQAKNQEGSNVQSELVKQLQLQLGRSKEEVAKKEKEMAELVSGMEERVDKAEDNVTKLEKELSATKGKLAEAEAHLIVSKREAEVAQSHDVTRPSRRKSRADAPTRSASSSIYHPDIMNMDEKNKVTRSRRTRSNSPNAIKRLELKLSEGAKKHKELEVEHDKLKEQQRMGEAHVKRLEEDIKVLQRQLYAKGETGVSTNMSRITAIGGSSNGADLLSDDSATKIDEIISLGDPTAMGDELRTLQKRCNAQRDYNNELLSKMLSLQGNIQVFCRIRPTSINEIQNGSKKIVESLSETELGCFDSRTNKWKSFGFDRVWGPDQGQQNIFQDVEPIALSVVDGFNACIFAYGQTGSGKTFTMEGVAENNQRGISFRTIQKVFHLLSLKQQQEKTNSILFKSQEDRDEAPANFVYGVEIGMLEIYNDECYDLLGASGASLAEKKKEAQKAGGKASLEIRRSKEGRIEVPNLTKQKVSNIEDVFELLAKGNKNRAVASTSLNQTSSRSHMVLWVDVTSGFEGQDGNKGTLFLVDLAGSERVKKSEVEGDHMKEAGYINKSLSALGNVMEALDRKASHIPYRDSKLTYLLQDSLGGNSRTMMIVAVTPVDAAYDESVHALQFATRVRRINIGAAQRNVTSKNLEETVKALTDEMKMLARQKQKTESQLNTLKKDNNRIQDKLSNLSSSRKAQSNDSKTLDILRKNNNEMAKRWEKEKNQREEVADELEKSRKELKKFQKSVTSLTREQESLKQKLDDKDRALEKRTTELRTAKEAASAANLRARKAQVLGSRARPTTNGSSRRTPAKSAGTSSVSTPTSSSATSAASTVATEEVKEIRAEVLKLLEKYDKSKVNRIDIIMEKFRGKEHLLLEKMTQRYENASNGNDGDETGMSRSELAAKRHADRMRKLRESKK
jgi:kinesin family protein C2/C3